ncbi:DUF5671 domain-containing protein [Phenylobacterium montanum]|uniref:DUF5671 domain-containing protein n=1 Tax=Phenylobacterium montanum TaxID=2823693 RepID=A0A975FX25_9CAUL|nr:DUF5671 domain-containing protein [Caulobacter sp. S6]QUD86839.1 hypothetical protein KCG34_17400 [Caulobacter sp. S6]
MNTELLEFTRLALEKGIARDQIASALRQAGWSEADVRAAANAFAPVEFPLPVPRPRPYLSAQEVFSYALFFAALYVSAFNLGALVFGFIDLAFPDVSRHGMALIAPVWAVGADRNELILDHMRGNIAALVVAFPLFLFMQRLIHRSIASDPTKRQSRPRKWMTYITLFIAASALIGDLSALVYNALGGDLTVRVVLRLATIAVIAGGAFSYLLWDIRTDERP